MPDIPTSDHYLYGVFVAKGRVATRCTSRDHEPPFSGPERDTHDEAMAAGRAAHDALNQQALSGSETNEEWEQFRQRVASPAPEEES